jgi:AcrR family transcriptional regulator
VPTTASADETTRRYESPMRARRAQETRAAVMAAARELFTTRGWAGTGMRDVAKAAGVATETVYSHFSSKRVLLQAVIDVAVVGDEEQVAVAERDEFAALGRGRRPERIAGAAALIRGINERTAAYAGVIREAAPGDQQISEVLAATRARQRRDVEAGLTLLLGRAPTTVEADEVWALLSPELYLLLVDTTGWTPDAYEAWMATLLERTLPPA